MYNVNIDLFYYLKKWGFIMESSSKFKTMVGRLIKKKYSKVVIFFSIILILILCLYLMSGDKSKLVMAITVQKGTTTGQPAILNAKTHSIVLQKGSFQFNNDSLLNCIEFSPDNKLIAHVGVPPLYNQSLYIFDTEKNSDTQLTFLDMTDKTSRTITSFTWIDNKHLLYTVSNTIHSSDNTPISQFNTFNIEDISTKKVTTIKEPDSNLTISCVAYSPEHNKVYLNEIAMANNSSPIEPNCTDYVYECSLDMRRRSLLFSIKDNAIIKISSIPDTDTILFSASKSINFSAYNSFSSHFPITISKYDIKTKKVQKIYETPAPYPCGIDFVPYSKNKVFMQQIVTSDHKYFDLNIKTGKCEEINLVNMPSNTQFAAFSSN